MSMQTQQNLKKDTHDIFLYLFEYVRNLRLIQTMVITLERGRERERGEGGGS